MADITSAQTGDWSVGVTWVGGVAPGTSDSATIAHTVTMDGDVTVINFTMNSATTFIGTGYTLTVTGNIVCPTDITAATNVTIIHDAAGKTAQWRGGTGPTRLASYTLAASANVALSQKLNTEKVFIPSGTTFGMGAYDLVLSVSANDSVQLEGSISGTANIDIGASTTVTNSYDIIITSGLATLRIVSGSSVFQQDGDLDMKGLPLQIASLYASGVATFKPTGTPTDLGDVQLGTGTGTDRIGKLDLTGATTAVLTNIQPYTDFDADNTDNNEVDFGSCDVTLSGTIDGEGNNSNEAIEFTSSNAHILEGGTATVQNVATLTGILYAIGITDGGGNVSNVIFKPPGGVLGYERVGGILGRRR